MALILVYLVMACAAMFLAVMFHEWFLRGIFGWPSLFRDVREEEDLFRRMREAHQQRSDRINEILRNPQKGRWGT